MKIYIKYINKKSLINTNNYQSVNSIIYEYLNKNNINNTDINDYFLEYNGIILNKDYSLEKYQIDEKLEKTNIYIIPLINLNRKIKGGASNKNKFIIIGMALLFSLLPIFLLPFGFFPSLASLIKIIIDKGLESLGRFLACDLGKVTMLKRMRTLVFIIKYVIFILLLFTAPASCIAPPNNNNFSVKVVFPASGWAIIPKVFRLFISFSKDIVIKFSGCKDSLSQENTKH